MPSLFSDLDRIAIQHRLERMTPESPRAWGTMAAHQTLCHLIDSFRFTFAEEESQVRPSWRNTWYGRIIAIDLPLRWRPGRIKAPFEFFHTPADHEFLWDRNRLIDYVHRFANGPHQDWGLHPVFGRLSPQRWAKLGWRHLDHHLRQFSG